jgi:hypothetical protein
VRTVRFAIAITSEDRGVTPSMVEDFGGELLFAQVTDVERWAKRADQGELEVVWFRFRGRGRPLELLMGGKQVFLPLVHRRRRLVEPVTSKTAIGRKSEVAVLMDTEKVASLTDLFVAGGWEPMKRPRRRRSA